MTAVTSAQGSPAVPRFREAYQRLIEEIRSVPADKLVGINLDIPTAVTTVLGALPEIRELRPSIVANLAGFDLDRFDKLEAYTLALGQAHALYLAASSPSESLEDLSQEAAALRELIHSDASALALRHLIDPGRLKELKGANGYRNIAFDLFTLAALMRAAWPVIASKTAVQASELDQAETLADKLLTAVGLRDQGPAVVAAAAEDRQRAFTLFIQAYDHARRAVNFLRWDADDGDQIAPSLYANRNNNKRKTPEDTPPPPHGPGPHPNPNPQPPSPAANAAAFTNREATVASAPSAVGLPGGSPFGG